MTKHISIPLLIVAFCAPLPAKAQNDGTFLDRAPKGAGNEGVLYTDHVTETFCANFLNGCEVTPDKNKEKEDDREDAASAPLPEDTATPDIE
ncbi:hypothetical protein [Puniceibacterium sp. IMCC21224]|uniref:hypothetical protein n=1 Tax=Puniceibacterium sp. IMCC21224 TaxID=1618204 RepID=UPI00064DC13C|nr:hypothetical protein [Puniceibacterium sp. IMCC21224]KMK67421.1 hypothetical protein IMCC21224_112290 [Puniceibacterium sp. IMCC21224]